MKDESHHHLEVLRAAHPTPCFWQQVLHPRKTVNSIGKMTYGKFSAAT